MKDFFKRDLHVIILVQVLSTIAIVAYLQYGFEKPKAATNDSSSAVNALSARMGQVQVDLNQIKAKLGAGQPATPQIQKKP